MRRNAEKETFWRKTMAEASGSGQSIRAFCQARGLKENRFYFWCREIKRRDAAASGRSGFVELVRAVEPASGAGVSVHIGERVRILLERGFDASALKAVLGALGEGAAA